MLRFSATIHLVSPRQFEYERENRGLKYYKSGTNLTSSAEPTAENVDFPYTIACRAKLRLKAFTKLAFNCLVGGISNKHLLSLAHLSPLQAISDKRLIQDRKWLEEHAPFRVAGSKRPYQMTPLGPIEDELMHDIYTLRQHKPNLPVRGFLTGGYDFDPAQCGQTSRRLFDGVRQALETLEVGHVSCIWGQRPRKEMGPVSVIGDTQDDTWFLCVEHNGDLEFDPKIMNDNYLNSRHYRSLASLHKVFTHIELAEGDTLVTSAGESLKGPYRCIST